MTTICSVVRQLQLQVSEKYSQIAPCTIPNNGYNYNNQMWLLHFCSTEAEIIHLTLGRIYETKFCELIYGFPEGWTT